ncbi:MAG: DUF4136 domain-containing protein [Myxococcota bacterium]
MTTKLRNALVLFVLGPLTLACAPGYQLDVRHPEAGFPEARSIAYGGAEALPEGFASYQPDERQRSVARQTARDVLTAAGWEVLPPERAADADILLHVAIGARLGEPERLVTNDPRLMAGSWDVEVNYGTGTLVVGAYERQSGALVWLGQVTKERLTGSASDELSAAVEELLSQLPPPAN